MENGLLRNIYDYASDIKTCVSSITTYWPGYSEILKRISSNADKIQNYSESADEHFKETKENDA